jgi:hypothetical protein
MYVCMYVFIYLYPSIHIYIYTHIYTHAHADTHTHAHTRERGLLLSLLMKCEVTLPIPALMIHLICLLLHNCDVTFKQQK